MHSVKRLLFNTMLGLCLGACDCDDDDFNDEVVTRVNPEADFSQYETFRIADGFSRGGLADAGVNTALIPDDVLFNLGIANDQARVELEKRGLTEVGDDAGVADLGVFSLAATSETGGYVWECVPGYWWGYWDYYWDPCAWLVPVYVEYEVGTLFLGLADSELEAVVFGGLAQGTIVESNDQGDAEERIRDAVTEMFLHYPK
jgi:hypothetical protein